MSLVSGIVLYVIIWWTALFAVLPWGVRVPDQPGRGHATSAPESPNLWRKALWTTLVAAILWLIVFGLVQSDLISFRRMADAIDG